MVEASKITSGSHDAITPDGYKEDGHVGEITLLGSTYKLDLSWYASIGDLLDRHLKFQFETNRLLIRAMRRFSRALAGLVEPRASIPSSLEELLRSPVVGDWKGAFRRVLSDNDEFDDWIRREETERNLRIG
jgi:hypothetical protein